MELQMKCSHLQTNDYQFHLKGKWRQEQLNRETIWM